MYRFIGLKWKDVAQDRDEWKAKVFLAKYKATKGAVTFAT